VRRARQDVKVQALARSPLFEGLSRKDLGQLARMSDELEVEPGKVLCREGSVGREFFVIIDGEADVTRNGRRVATCGPGDFFGEIALLENVKRTATVTAKTPLHIFVVTGRSFRSLLDDVPSVERKVLRALARRVLSSSPDPVAR
jgi:CRP/FNR family transcriptional regulator, cyclic AMP receptor protein